MRSRSAFTLIELLVVIAIVAILAVVVVLVLNPAQLLQQARDSNRLSDIATINSALGYYTTDAALSGTLNLGSVSTTYASVADSSATSTVGDQCQGLGFPSSTYVWHCAASSTYRKGDNTGWIPVNFAGVSNGSPLGQLPVDPANTTSTNLFYTYQTDGSKYEVTAIMESAKYKSQFATNPQIQGYPEVAAAGSSLSLSGLWNPSGLVGLWPLTEGSGSSSLDQSGNGNNGAWNGTIPYYAAGKVGSYAGTFSSSSNNWVNIGNLPSLGITSNMTLAAWINSRSFPAAANNGIVSKGYNTAGNRGYVFVTSNFSLVFCVSVDGSAAYACGTSLAGLSLNTWQHVAVVYAASAGRADFYINGNLSTSTTGLPTSVYNTSQPFQIGTNDASTGQNAYNGLLNDIRVYNRALSAAEVMALYNAEK